SDSSQRVCMLPATPPAGLQSRVKRPNRRRRSDPRDPDEESLATVALWRYYPPRNSSHLSYPERKVPMTEQPDNQLGQFIPVHYHYDMLRDQYRMTAFQEAISEVVKVGNRVV